MGFLDGLVGSMLKESTGYDVRKITRMVGGKNLLMLGAGAAVAGGLASGFGQGENDGPSTWGDPPNQAGSSPARPPLPPTPTVGAAKTAAPVSLPPLPDLPPVPGTRPPALNTPQAAGPPALPTPEVAAEPPAPEPQIAPELTYGIVRTMVAAALADGSLGDDERKLILDRLEESGLAAEQVQQIHQDLVIPPTVEQLAELTDSVDQRQAMYRFAGVIVLSDGEVSDLERGWLNRLALAFGFDAETRSQLEAEIFTSP